MIFVTVGSHHQGFERLIRKMDEITGKIDEEVIMQIGHTKYVPKNAKYFDFREKTEEIEQLNREARIVVSHAGVGSIITAFKQGTPIIIVPRLKRFGEHIDDHQMEIADAISGDPRVIVVHEIDDLEKSIKVSIEFVRDSKDSWLSNSIREYLAILSQTQKLRSL